MVQSTFAETWPTDQVLTLVLEAPEGEEERGETQARLQVDCPCPTQSLHGVCPLQIFGFADGRYLCDVYLDGFAHEAGPGLSYAGTADGPVRFHRSVLAAETLRLSPGRPTLPPIKAVAASVAD